MGSQCNVLSNGLAWDLNQSINQSIFICYGMAKCRPTTRSKKAIQLVGKKQVLVLRERFELHCSALAAASWFCSLEHRGAQHTQISLWEEALLDFWGGRYSALLTKGAAQ